MRNTVIILFLFILSLSIEAGKKPWSVKGITSPPSLHFTDTIPDNIKLGRDALYRQGKADAYRMIAELEEEKGDYPVALHYYFSSIYELEILGDSIGIANTQIKIGSIFEINGLFIKALEYYTAAELIFLNTGRIADHANLLFQTGKVYYAIEEYEKALQYYRRTGMILQNTGADRDYIATQYESVKCFNALNEYTLALETNHAILSYYQKENDRKNEIVVLNNLGFTHKHLENYQDALEYFEKAAKLENETTGNKSPVTLVNQAIVYQNMNDPTMALRKLDEAAINVDGLEDERLAAEYNHLTSLVYYTMHDLHNALLYNNACIKLGEKNNDAVILEQAYLLSSRIHQSLYDYEEAMLEFQKHLLLKDSISRQQMFLQQELNKTAIKVEEITRETEKLWASEELSYLELQRLKLDSANRQQELEILYKADSIHRITIQNQQLENQRAQQALLLKEEQVYAAKKAKEVDSLRQIEKIQSLELEKQQLVQKDQKTQIAILDKENVIAELSLKKVKTRNKWLIAFAGLALVIIYLVYRGLRYAKKTNRLLIKQNNEIERQRDEIEHERQRSDKLLLNILPEETAEELKEKGSATPRHYDKVSVLFTDFKGFTTIAEKLSPQELVAELDNCFLEFDKIIDSHNLEKIKTIGDAYMCAGGIPVANDTNPSDIVGAALEIKDYMERLKTERESKGEAFWELRLGIHTGPVIAGVVGKNKFAYDIWGDAVNTASRMESSGIPGKVNISGITYKLVKDKFKCTYRGKVMAKNKGEIDMYIVEGKK